MKLKQYFENLKQFIEENPDSLEMEVVTSCDDEGNSYDSVYYKPSKGIFEDREFIDISQCEEWGRKEEEVNAVCIN